MVFVALHSGAQTLVKMHAGYSYLEHFSAGPIVEWRSRHSVSVRYGSNFFYQPANFSTFFAEYQRSILPGNLHRLIPAAGIKIGYTIFTDEYYRWNIVSVVPLFSLRYRASDRLDLVAGSGVAICRIESVTRIHFGEIGKYKQYLPEFNVAIHYSMRRMKQ